MTKCLWCHKRFTPRASGSPQKFCCTTHRHAFWQAARDYVDREVEAGRLGIAALKDRKPSRSSAHAASEASGG